MAVVILSQEKRSGGQKSQTSILTDLEVQGKSLWELGGGWVQARTHTPCTSDTTGEHGQEPRGKRLM